MSVMVRGGAALAAFPCVGALGMGGGLLGTARGEVEQGENVRVTFRGNLTPRSLPRDGLAPVRVAVGAGIAPTAAGAAPPALRHISIAINRHGVLDSRGLPVCHYNDVQPTTTANALAACGASLVGKGSFSAAVLLPQAAPFPSDGELYAFSGTYRGKPAILAHVYGTTPLPTSYTIPFTISSSRGEYGTVLSAPMPTLDSEWGYVTGLSLNLGRRFSYRGERRSYLSAACPAPRGVNSAPFDFARAIFDFGSGTLTSTLSRSCRPR